MKRATIAILVAGSLFSAACNVGPRYKRPATPVPETIRGAEPQSDQASIADLAWWELFRDEQLQSLIRAALAQNYDLRSAVERIAEARAQLGITRSARYPDVSLDASATAGKAQGGTKSTFFTLAPDASYQLDLFGKVHNQIVAGQAQVTAAEESRNSVILSLVGEVAADYFQLLTLDAALKTAQDTAAAQESSVTLVKTRLEYGATTQVELLQAQQVLDSARAQIPDLERQIAQTENALNLLAGRLPAGIERGKLLDEQYLPPAAPEGVPSSLLERRPDIRSAEQQLIVANANIGVARAAFFPNISFSVSGGGTMGHATSASSGQTTLWSAAGQLSQPIFNGGRLRSNLKVTEAQQREALLTYQQTIQKSFGEVSDAAIGYHKLHEVRLQQDSNVKHLAEAEALSRQRYEGGLVAYSEVLDAQRVLFSARLSLAQARGNEQIALVTLYKTLGGGWQK
ncbi:MAG: efflux transporter outer membrane subunit [Acidobacteriota bacterium]|nr:efflux transporter outer membrane subunit [Acidobacteriota bacterium]